MKQQRGDKYVVSSPEGLALWDGPLSGKAANRADDMVRLVDRQTRDSTRDRERKASRERWSHRLPWFTVPIGAASFVLALVVALSSAPAPAAPAPAPTEQQSGTVECRDAR